MLKELTLIQQAQVNELEARQWKLEQRMEREADPENRLRHDWELLEMRKQEILAL